MKLRYLVMSMAFLAAIVAGIAVYRMELTNIRSSAAETFDVRANLIRQYIRLMRHNVRALKKAVANRYEQLKRDSSLAPELSAIRYHVEHDIWGISGLESEGGIGRLSGTLTGTDKLKNPSELVQKELTAVLAIDGQFEALLEDVPDIVWVYYTSTNEFIYISPDPAISDFRFSKELWTKKFWTQAAPALNPFQRVIISDLYDDYYGQGLMISISAPVELDGRFTGVVSLDLGIDLLRSLTGVGAAEGESVLVDEGNKVVARHGDFDPEEEYVIPQLDGWIESVGKDAYWLTTGVSEGELRLLHRLPKTELYRAAAAKSSIFWVVFAAMLGLVAFSLRLNDALSKVRFLMNRDPLTGLLNRRGFTASAESLRTMARGNGRNTALLMLDIDHFKQVNDTYGHDVGDQVLVSIGERLSVGVKEYDLVCRWGGEEIVVFLVYEESAMLDRIADRLRLSIGEKPLSDHDLQVTVSGGLTIWEWEETLDRAVDRADQLLYVAKSAGRDRIESDVTVDT